MTKPWKRQPVAPQPLPPTRPRVYKVDKSNFRDLVQKLTGADEVSDHRIQTMAPAQLNVGPPMLHGSVVTERESSLLAMEFPPSSHNWYGVPLPSPGTHGPSAII